MGKKTADKRELPLFRCTRFNCKRSFNKWQCCYYCESKEHCKEKCNCKAVDCKNLMVDSRITNY